MTPVYATLPSVLAQKQPPPNAPEFGSSSPIGLVVIVLLFIAMGLLVRSMNTHLRKVPASFDEPDPAERADTAERSDSGGGDDAGPAAEPEGDGERRDR